MISDEELHELDHRQRDGSLSGAGGQRLEAGQPTPGQATGEGLTEAVITALEERLRRERGRAYPVPLSEELAVILPETDAAGAFVLMFGFGVFDNTSEFQICRASALTCAPGNQGSGDGQFSNPIGIVSDPLGNVFIVDTGNNRVQKFNYAPISPSRLSTGLGPA